MTLPKTPCQACGVLFTAKMGGYGRVDPPRRQRTCSIDCWTSIRYSQNLVPHPSWRDANAHKCDHCGELFRARRHEPRKYCSKSCWHKAHSINISSRLTAMPPGTRWNHRDLNEPALVSAAEKLGATWWEFPPLDGWIWRMDTGFVPVEIKRPSRRGHASEFTPAQKEFLAFCKATGGAYWIWYTVDDVLRDLGGRRTA